jgi:hypothetical protein
VKQLRLTVCEVLLLGFLISGALLSPASGTDDVSTIDILMLYTPAMSDYYGGENGAVARSIELVEVANEAFENSGLVTRLRMVGAEVVDYVEDQDDVGIDLDRLKDDDDGFADGIHEQREKHGADLVALLRDGTAGGFAGMAYMLVDVNGRPSSAFSVTDAQQSNSWHAFTHEIGHNLGGAHDRVAASGPGLFDYSYGHHIDALDVMTIMSYARNYESRVPYFSNPSLYYRGYALGVPSSSPESADNAKTIELSTPIVAAYRKSLPTIPEFEEHEAVRYVKNGSNITLQSRALGLPEMSLQWFRGFKGDRSEPLGTSQLQETGPINEPSVFWLDATNPQGTAVSETIVLIPSDNYTSAESVAMGENHTVNYYVDDSSIQSFSVGEDMRVLEELRLRMRKRGTVLGLRITLSDEAGRILIQETLSGAEIENALNGNWLPLAADAGFAVEAGETFELELSLLGEYDSENYVSWSYEESSTSGVASSYTMEIIGTKNAGPSIAISPASASLASESGVLDVQINSDGAWQIFEDTDWIGSSVSAGSNSQIANFYYYANNGTSQRSAEVIIGTEVLIITQAADVDTDGDGMTDRLDPDDDNDGVPDTTDAFPLDSNESMDTDSDGIGNNADTDDDNDGVHDPLDAFPLDPSESLDTDGDGIGNNSDNDDDGDGAYDGFDAFPLDPTETQDTDGDGTGNNADSDDDGDGVNDSQDRFPLDSTESLDTDNDGVGNNSDNDDDGDGAYDVFDAFPLDPGETLDTDGDGVGNNADSDDDGDGVSDSEDVFPLDDQESLDTDDDGLGNNADPDDDGDGYNDAIEQLAGGDPLNSADSEVSASYIVENAAPLVGSAKAEGVRLVTSSPEQFDLHDQASVESARTTALAEGREEVLVNPSEFALVDLADVPPAKSLAVEQGRNEVLSSPNKYGLFSESDLNEAALTGKSIINVSTRVFLSSGETITPGFVVLGEERKLLIRAVGPKLADLGVVEPLSDPKMSVYKARFDGQPPELIGSADNWKTDRGVDVDSFNRNMETVGAFPLEPTPEFQGREMLTDDRTSAVLTATFATGVYTVLVSSADEETGEVLVEVYEIPD